MIIKFSQVWGSFKKWPDLNLIATSLLKFNKAISSDTYIPTPSHTQAHTNPKKMQLEELKIRSATSQGKIQRLELCYGQNREGSLCPQSVNSQEPFLLNSYRIQGKVLGVQDHRYREGATLYNKRSHRVVILPSVGLDLEYPYCDPVRERESEQHLDSK